MDGTESPSIYEHEFFAAWEKCADQISLAFEAVESQSKSRPLATQQIRYVLAIISLSYFLDNIGQRDLAKRFHFLAEAMNDLVEGIPHQLFKVEAQKKRGRQPDTSAVWRIRSSLCTAISILVAGGMTEDEAILFVVKKYKSEFGKLLRPKAGLQSSIKTWLKSFESDEVRNEVALASYKQGKITLASLQPRVSGDQILEAGKGYVALIAKEAESLVQT